MCHEIFAKTGELEKLLKKDATQTTCERVSNIIDELINCRSSFISVRTISEANRMGSTLICRTKHHSTLDFLLLNKENKLCTFNEKWIYYKIPKQRELKRI